jgi:hypothetical protein
VSKGVAVGPQREKKKEKRNYREVTMMKTVLMVAALVIARQSRKANR